MEGGAESRQDANELFDSSCITLFTFLQDFSPALCEHNLETVSVYLFPSPSDSSACISSCVAWIVVLLWMQAMLYLDTLEKAYQLSPRYEKSEHFVTLKHTLSEHADALLSFCWGQGVKFTVRYFGFCLLDCLFFPHCALAC